ncbi:MAG TPA: FAD-dependent oxidoreductase [Rhizomicrobium sp.]|jgi:3-phenylpropionate/trans-cinnamate dioxygenase ferredoxin reductase subunit|nr:FAD-dependent oxidoreductase [Rhizomicrobium sp.]
MSEKIVIIGAGQAGAQAVQSLRAEGFDGGITLIGEEPWAPYQRPPLSKAYLLGQFERARLFLKSDSYYPGAGCELLLNTRVASIHRGEKFVDLTDGRRLPYDKLLLTTGARVRRLPCPGSDLPGIHYLKTITDVDGLQAAFKPGARLAIVGGGYIGLEVAAVAAKRGLEVMVFEAMDRLMARSVSPQLSDFYAAEHEKAGVTLKLRTGVEAFEGTGKVERIRAGGELYPADLVLVGIGVIANDELARAAGLGCEDGIVVDRNAMTGDPAIWAAGDCTRHVGREGTALRLECVQNAIDQAKHAALAMVGKPKPYSEVPWFWSDQYDLKLQIAGLARQSDRIVLRGDPASRKFAAFHLRDDVVAAVEAVNAAPEYLMGKKLIADAAKITAERLADLSVPMKQMAA